MKNVRIHVTCHGREYVTTFRSDKPEYVIADEAYRLALIFADTCALADYGHRIPSYQFATYLEDLDYDYSFMQEVEN